MIPLLHPGCQMKTPILETKPSRKLVLAVFTAIFVFEACFAWVYAQSKWPTLNHGGIPDMRATGMNYIAAPGHEYDYFDCAGYNWMAYTLLEKGGFHNPSGFVSAWYTPGYPMALAILYGVFGYSYPPALLFNALCVTLAYYFLFRLGRDLFGSTVSWVVLLLLVCNLRVSYHAAFIFTDLLFFFLTALTLYLVYVIIIRKNQPFYLLALLGFVCGFAALVRPVMIPAGAALGIIFLVERVPLCKIGVFLAFVCMVFGSWLVRNYVQFGRLVVSTSSDWFFMAEDYDAYRSYSFFSTYRLVMKKQTPVEQMRDKGEALHEPDVRYMEDHSFLFRDQFDSWRKQNRSYYYWLIAWRFKALLMPYAADMSARDKVIAFVLWSLTFPPAALAGLFLRREKFYWIILLLALGMFVMPSLFTVDAHLRYQLPAQLYLTLPAGYFWYRCALWLRRLSPEPRPS